MLGLLMSMMMLPTFDPAILTVPVAHAQELTKEWTIEEMKILAEEKAKKYGLHVYRFKETIRCESDNWNRFAQGDWTLGDGKFYHKSDAPPGSWPTSFGLAQFHHPTQDWDMTIEDAYDPEISLEKMALAWSRGEHRRWSCWILLFG